LTDFNLGYIPLLYTQISAHICDFISSIKWILPLNKKTTLQTVTGNRLNWQKVKTCLMFHPRE